MKTSVLSRALVATTIAMLATLVPAIPGAAAGDKCNIRSADRDTDGIVDCWEVQNGLVPGLADSASDLDGDALSALWEYRLDAGTPADRMFAPYKANVADSDADGLSDGAEDVDTDAVTNQQEIADGTDPLDPLSHSVPGPVGECAEAPISIASDGSRDVTTELENFIASVPNGGCVQLRPGGRYRVDETVDVVSRHDLLIDGMGATLFTDALGPVPTSGKGAGASSRSHLAFLGGSNITVQNLVIDGPKTTAGYNSTYEFEHGVKINGVDGIVVRQLTITQVCGDLVFISDNGATPSRNVTISDNDLSFSGRQGVTISGSATGVVIDGNRIESPARSGIDMEPIPGRFVSDVRITNNSLSGFGLNWLAGGGQSPITDVYVGFNTVTGRTLRLKVGGPSRERWVFEGNRSDTIARGVPAIFSFGNANNMQFIGNVQPAGAMVPAIAPGGCNYFARNNDFTGASALFVGSPTCSWVDGGGNLL